ncbi:CLIP domain-containing serine protease HP8-like [Cydia amplana]|uniref:CLIP domain-containing serine protease HP8-like n=1 Tax=Cydia amplana TaxID=1869771 RepID=UPI002FE54CAC
MIKCTVVLVVVIEFVYPVAGNNDNIRAHPAWKLLQQFECGDSAADRIIGGFNAGLGQFPWIARLGYTSEDDPEIDWMCGGVLITNRHVLTAAHCITDEDSGYKLSFVRLGEHNTETDPDCQLHVCAPKVQDRKPKVIRPEANFNNPAFQNDIAIISLDSPVQLHDYVAPICLPYTDEQLAPLPLGEMLTVAGWGKMNMTTEERAKILQYVQIPVVEKSACNLFGKAFKMTAMQICAGAIHNKDACGGDSGGPVMKVFDNDEGPKNYLIGVVSFGPTICGIKKPGVYSSSVEYLRWILDNILAT